MGQQTQPTESAGAAAAAGAEVCLGVPSRDRYRGVELAASRRIQPGEVVLRERPLAVAPPRQLRRCYCFACGLRLTDDQQQQQQQKGRKAMQLCGAAECAELAAEEAEAVEAFPWLFDHEELLLLLRLLLQLRMDPARGGLAFELEDLPQMLAGDEQIQQNAHDVMEALPDLCLGLGEADVARLLRAIRVNALGVNETHAKAVALLPNCARLSHSCAPNCFWVYGADRLFEVRASHSIAEGEALTIGYCDLALPTPQRRRELLSTKYFLCLCERCADPFELGRHSSTLFCPRCGDMMGLTRMAAVEAEGRPQGELLPDHQDGILAFLDQGGCDAWSCSSCAHDVDATADEFRAVREALHAANTSFYFDVGAIVSLADSDASAAEAVVANLCSPEVERALAALHPHHHLRHQHSLVACVANLRAGRFQEACRFALEHCETADNIYSTRSSVEDCPYRLAGAVLERWGAQERRAAASLFEAAGEAGGAADGLQLSAAAGWRKAAQLYDRAAALHNVSAVRFAANRGAAHPLAAAAEAAARRCTDEGAREAPGGGCVERWSAPGSCTDGLDAVCAHHLARAAAGDLCRGALSQGTGPCPDAAAAPGGGGAEGGEVAQLRAALAEMTRHRDEAVAALAAAQRRLAAG